MPELESILGDIAQKKHDLPLEKQAEELEQAVDAYLQAQEKYVLAGKLLEKAEKEKPPKITQGTYSEIVQYATAVKQCMREIERAENDEKWAANNLECKNRIVLAWLPLSNCWIKVGTNAVGFHYDSWGGNHMVLQVLPWSNKLPELKNITEYP